MPIQAPQWTEFLSCPICCHEFDGGQRGPISLGCGHTVCRACLAKLQRNQCPYDQVSPSVVWFSFFLCLFPRLGLNLYRISSVLVYFQKLPSWNCTWFMPCNILRYIFYRIPVFLDVLLFSTFFYIGYQYHMWLNLKKSNEGNIYLKLTGSCIHIILKDRYFW